jgi:hypothetical protein
MGAVTPPPVVAEPSAPPQAVPDAPPLVPLDNLPLPGAPVAAPTGRGSRGGPGQ